VRAGPAGANFPDPAAIVYAPPTSQNGIQMSKIRRAGMAVLTALTVTLAVAQAQEHPGKPERSAAERPAAERSAAERSAAERAVANGPGVLSLLPADAVTEHSITLPSGRLDYTATAGTLNLFDQSGERSAAIYYNAFVARTGGGSRNPRRPITFVFNGGPGAASAFLNLGLVGPRVVQFGDGTSFDAARVRLIDNPDSWLVFTDLVLIDPVGTGWSRAARSDGASAFYNVRRDAESLAKAIALYAAKNGRAEAPKYILGESYGGFRAAKVARALQNEQGIVVAGIIMISPLIEGEFHFGGDRFALGAALALPSLAAAELERAGNFSLPALASAERFALTDYLSALAGPPLAGEAAQAFYQRVARLTGVPADVVAKSRGFIGDAFMKNLRASEHRLVSHYDATFALADPHPEAYANRGADPFLDGFIRGYGGAYAAYARDELGFKTEMTYVLLADDVSGNWDWQSSGRASPSASEDLRELLALTPSFRLLIAHGFSDMVTPYAVSRYVLDHIPDSVGRDRAELRLYRGGHMFYVDPKSRAAFTADARKLYAAPDR
jgi:carboxypeptidase C (cathepsin A)